LKHRKLFQGAMKKNFFSVKNSGYFYQDDIDLNIKDAKGNCPLYYCVLNEDVPFIEWLLQKKSNPNFICTGGNTPLHIAF
jgi:ankyrin repeat protein